MKILRRLGLQLHISASLKCRSAPKSSAARDISEREVC